MTVRLLALATLLPLLGCRYGLNPDVDPNADGGGFTCASNADCGAGWHCNLHCASSDFTPYCLPNSECDPCPSLSADPGHCGSCSTSCAQGQSCVDGLCVSD
jgi:hypothetical protein